MRRWPRSVCGGPDFSREARTWGGRRRSPIGTASTALLLIAAAARLVRLNSGITSAVSAVLTAWLAKPPVPPTEMTLIACVVLALSSGGYALNDVCDRNIDRINQPGRPIPRGAIGVQGGLLIASSCLIVAVALVLPLSAWCIVLTLSDIVLLIAYALYLKVLGALKTIIVGYLVASGFLIGAFTFDRIGPVIATLIACAFFATMGREIVKDIQDMDGDHRHCARTLPIMAGPRVAYAAAFICLALSLLLGAIPYAIGSRQQLLFGTHAFGCRGLYDRLALAAKLGAPLPIYDHGRFDRCLGRVWNRELVRMRRTARGRGSQPWLTPQAS